MKSLTTLTLVMLAGCGAAPTTATAPVSHGVQAPQRPALGLELQVVTARGQLRARGASGEWKALPQGASLAGVRELMVTRRGAVLALGHGDAAGRLWLRAGSAVRLGQDGDGVHVAMVSGRARLRRAASALPLFVDAAAGSRAVEGDVILETREDGATELIATGARPELAGWALALERDEDGAGIGRMEAEAVGEVPSEPGASPSARPGTSPSASPGEPLALRKVIVTVETAGDLAITSVEHVFYNPADQNREGTFRFPVPDGALLTGLAMEVHGKLIEGEIVEREKAREIYDHVVDEMQDPALLEWEQGNWFKLRVFPIEARADKRVVIRYASPLSHGAAGWEYGFALAAPQAPIGELTVVVDGKVVEHETQVATGLDLAIPVGAAKVPAVMREVRSDGIYTAVRIGVPAGVPLARGTAGPRRIAVLFDTSRSALEGKSLALELVRRALSELGPQDQFVVLASDVAVTAQASGYVAATPESIQAALAFLDRIEPDGASDLGAALAAVATRTPTEVLYVGDGIPTWGERGSVALSARSEAVHAPIHAGLIGKGASTELWAELAGRSGGRAVVVRTSLDAERFALVATHASEVPRLRNARVELVSSGAAPSAPSVSTAPTAPTTPGSAILAGSTVFPASATTIYAGDELVVLLRTPADAPPPTSLVLTGLGADGPIRSTISLGTPGTASAPVLVAHVAQRWAAYALNALDAADAPREDIVKLSEDLGVMSRYTSLLVLENDEAFQQHQIERRKAAEQARLAAAPQITGGDLDTLGTREASLSPDEVQPGDPEIKIPAPADARSVVVSFPFGETKLAVWDVEANAWMVRFLIDKDTPDGDYLARVTISHADGRIEVISLPYTVDTVAPTVQLTVTRVATGYRLRARQVAGASGARRVDADQVEVVLPDGTVLTLAPLGRGQFSGLWTTAPLATPTTLRVVVRDRALNQAIRELTLGGS